MKKHIYNMSARSHSQPVKRSSLASVHLVINSPPSRSQGPHCVCVQESRVIWFICNISEWTYLNEALMSHTLGERHHMCYALLVVYFALPFGLLPYSNQVFCFFCFFLSHPDQIVYWLALTQTKFSFCLTLTKSKRKMGFGRLITFPKS